jgi:voltage-gated potassium channel Kch
MAIPMPTLPVLLLALVLAVFTVLSRLATTFPPLFAMRQGLRASLVPAINLSQVSEFSLVLLQLGVTAGHIGTEANSAASLAFVLLATLSTLAMGQSSRIARATVPRLRRLGLRDLDDAATAEEGEAHGHGARIIVLGFFRTASSLLAELERKRSGLIEQLAVVDFNPVVHQALSERGVRVLYGDISQPATLVHAGIEQAEILISTVPDYLLKGTSNERLVRHLRSVNAKAIIIATADVLSEVETLYAAGANYVTLSRIIEAADLAEVLESCQEGLIDQKRAELDKLIADRREVLA